MLEREWAPESPDELAYRLVGLLDEYPGDARSVRRILDEGIGGLGAGDGAVPRALPVLEIEGSLPKAVLGAKGQSGMVLAEGYICVLAAEGGIGKSSLVGTVALETAMGGEGVFGIFSGTGGRVLLVTYEDAAIVTRWRLEGLAEAVDRQRGGSAAREALGSVFVVDMESWPLYGPPEFASYATRPAPLRGWEVLWGEVARLQPKLIIIDPVLKGYVGESNGVSPVREFLGSLRHQVGLVCPEGAGVLVTAHSTKAARGSRGGSRGPDAFDPGHVSGSAAWIDEPRGVLTMTWGEGGMRELSVVKANLGPSRIVLTVRPVQRDDGMVLGFAGDGVWHQLVRDEVLPGLEKGNNSGSATQNTLSGLGSDAGDYEGIAR